MKAFAEHDVVKVTRDINDGTRTPLKKNQTGTIVSIYEKGIAFAVEFENGNVETVFGSELESANT